MIPVLIYISVILALVILSRFFKYNTCLYIVNFDSFTERGQRVKVHLKLWYKLGKSLIFPMVYAKVIAAENHSEGKWSKGDILLFDNAYSAWDRTKCGSYALTTKINDFNDDDKNPLKISKCLSCTWGFPLIFDGSETLGIGYDTYGSLTHICTAESGYKKIKEFKL